MAEEATATQESAAQEATEPQGEATDWKAEARKWERRAKENSDAAAELESLKAERMSEQERAQARAVAAEKELAEMKAEAERVKAMDEVAEATGVPRKLLAYCADRDAMEAFAKEYAAQAPQVHAAPRAQQVRISGGTGKGASTAQLFGEAMDAILG